MSCEICGRNSCVKSFHSLEEQSDFDNIADDIKDRMRSYLSNKINRLSCYEVEGESGYFVNLDDVIGIIDYY